MRKLKIIVMSFVLISLVGCSEKMAPRLAGSYQSELVDGYVIQLAVQPEDNTFVQYIDNREVDRGVVESQSGSTYLFIGNKKEFETTVSVENTIGLSIAQINDGNPIELENLSEVPTYFSTEFDDVKEYEELLNKK